MNAVVQQDFSPLVCVNPSLVLDVPQGSREPYHLALTTLAYYFKLLGREAFFLNASMVELLNVVKNSMGELPDLSSWQDEFGYAREGRDEHLSDVQDNLVLIDGRVYRGQMFFIPIENVANEEQAFGYVQTVSTIIGANVNRIIRRMEAERGVKVATTAEVQTTLTQQPVQHEANPGDAYSPLVIEAREVNGVWCVMMVVLDDVEALPDPIVQGALSVVREAIGDFWTTRKLALPTGPATVLTEEGVKDALPQNPSSQQ